MEPWAPGSSACTGLPHGRRDLDTLVDMEELEKENDKLRSEVERLRETGGHSLRDLDPGRHKHSGRCCSRSSSRPGLRRKSSLTSRRASGTEAVTTRLNEALLENEEVLEKNKELQEQVRKLLRAQLRDRKTLASQEAALKDLSGRAKLLEDEKLELKSLLQDSNQKLLEMEERSGALQHQDRNPSLPFSQQTKADGPLHRPGGAALPAGSPVSCAGTFLEEENQEEQLLALHEELAVAHADNQRVSSVCEELQAMLAAEQQAAAQARQEVHQLQGQLAAQRVRQRSSAARPAAESRSSSTQSRTSDLMHQLLSATGHEEPGTCLAGHGSEEQEGPALGPCDWMHVQMREEQLPEQRRTMLGPGTLAWLSQAFTATLCCSRSPHLRGIEDAPSLPEPAPAFRGAQRDLQKGM